MLNLHFDPGRLDASLLKLTKIAFIPMIVERNSLYNIAKSRKKWDIAV